VSLQTGFSLIVAARNLQAPTIDFYRLKLGYLIEAAGERPPTAITTAQMKMLITHYREKRQWSVGTANHAITAWKVFFHYLYQEEIIDRFPWDFADEEGKNIIKLNMEKWWQSISEILKIKYIRSDGLPLWAHVSSKSFFDEAGRFTGILAMLTDITERKKAEEALRESNVENQKLLAAVQAEKERLSRAEEALRVANAQLTEADQRKNEFLAVLSHELRNPLTPIRNSLYILERVAPGGDQARRAQNVISRQSGQLARLVDDLLDVTRISRNKIQLQRGPLDLNELVRRTVEDHHSLFEGKGIAVETSFAAERLPISGDAARLAQVVGNLLHNAAKFTPAGGHVVVSTAIATSRARATLRVNDNGVGIEPAMLRRLFEPFMQAEATLDRSKGGLGLGLALVKGLVEMHGGDVCAHSDGPGKGAEFVVELPLCEELSPQVGGNTAQSGSGALAGETILLVEDQKSVRSFTGAVLKEYGYHVIEASDGDEATAVAEEYAGEIHLLLTDVVMPGISGKEAAERMKEVRPNLKVLFMSGYTADVIAQRGVLDRSVAFLHKPFSPVQLAAKVRELLSEPSEPRVEA